MADAASPAVIDGAKLAEKIKERVKALFLDVIPEDAWDGFVRREIDAFFNVEAAQMLVQGEMHQGDWAYGHWRGVQRVDVKATPFRVCVFGALLPLVEARLRKALDDPKFATRVGVPEEGPAKLGPFLTEQLQVQAPVMLRLMFEAVFAQTADRVKDELLRVASMR